MSKIVFCVFHLDESQSPITVQLFDLVHFQFHDVHAQNPLCLHWLSLSNCRFARKDGLDSRPRAGSRCPNTVASGQASAPMERHRHKRIQHRPQAKALCSADPIWSICAYLVHLPLKAVRGTCRASRYSPLARPCRISFHGHSRRIAAAMSKWLRRWPAYPSRFAIARASRRGMRGPLDAPYDKYLDCADHKKPSCPHVDRTRRAYVTLDAILGYGGRTLLLFRIRLTTLHC